MLSPLGTFSPHPIISTGPPLENLVGWYKADALPFYNDGDSVTTAWTDSSGNGRDFPYYTGICTYKANQIKGKPAIQFSESSFYYSNQSVFIGDGKFTFMVVFKVTSIDTDQTLPGLAYFNNCLLHTPDYASYNCGFYSSGPGMLSQAYDGTHHGATQPCSIGTWHRVLFQCNASVVAAKIDGGTDYTDSCGPCVSPGGTLFMPGGGFIGYIAEMLGYNADIGATNLTALDSYINSKYF